MIRSDGSVLCIGELVWDIFPDEARIGGAPFNVAVHLARQGERITLLTAVGRDELGSKALSFLEQEGIPGALVHPKLPTGTVTVELDPGGVPCFTIHAHGAWTDLEGAFLAGISPLRESIDLAQLSVIVFGGLAMHSPANRLLFRDLMRDFLKQGIPLPIRLCDLNLRPGWSDPGVVRWCANQADVLKVNEEELRFLKDLEPNDLHETDLDLFQQFPLQGLCITLGPEGLRWMDHAGETFTLAPWTGEDVLPVIDTVGAGDAITASMAQGLRRKESARTFLDRGRRWAAMVCGIQGALLSRQA